MYGTARKHRPVEQGSDPAICRRRHRRRECSTSLHQESGNLCSHLRVVCNREDLNCWLRLTQTALDNKLDCTTGVDPCFSVHGFDATPAPLLGAKVGRKDTAASSRAKGEAIVHDLRAAQDIAQAAMAAVQRDQEHHANRTREAPRSFKIGDKVWWLGLPIISATILRGFTGSTVQ
ncbi:hypothetical protein CERZMDRAFT_84382 [Cercospora zeae-maydis SCOH1-5]|uniref:Uncharacterized protein n=1 Tax=Cercospora zeae-maydis SCOH1-5 TaxID=717836 RepID=A0A6A6FH14_9PEZI|nr:hypothetical protein CERZMDRAFT_84382 [Cercospora zeae-maydis SCOH1-5]